MEKTVSEKIRLGLFVIVGLLIFVLAVYFIGEKQKMFGQTDQLNAVFNNVNGLQLGNNVRYSGINIGTVKEIEFVSDDWWSGSCRGIIGLFPSNYVTLTAE